MTWERGQLVRVDGWPAWVCHPHRRNGQDGLMVYTLPRLRGRPVRAAPEVGIQMWTPTPNVARTCQHQGIDREIGVLYCGQPPAVNSVYCVSHQVDHGELD